MHVTAQMNLENIKLKEISHKGKYTEWFIP